MNLKDIDTLATLARLDIPTEEKESVLRDLDSILKYIDQISLVRVPDETEIPTLRNVMRKDEHPNSGGTYTEKILAEIPHSKDGYLKVKKILSYDD